jgi:DNA-binding transcriptional ArsR family regulator
VAHLASTGQASITDVAAPFDVSLMAISKHVKVLREAMVVTVEREGRTNWCSVNFEALRFAREWLEFNERLSRELELSELVSSEER